MGAAIDDEPAVRITLSTIYEQLQTLTQKVLTLTEQLPAHVSITKEKQEEYETRLENHGTRLGEAETRLTRLEGNIRPRAPWYAVVGAIVGILGGGGSIVAIVIFLSRLTLT